MSTMQNADPQELEKFGELAHRWWDAEGEFRPLHQINPLRLGWISSHVSLTNTKALDVGCGGGILAESMAQVGAEVLGVDLSTKPLKVARLHALEAGVLNVSYREVAVEALADECPGRFDVVTCMEMLEHVPDPASVVRACATLVRPGGWVFFSTLNRQLKAYLLAILAAEHLLGMIPKGTHQYERFLQPSELAKLARQAGLSVRASSGLVYNPLTQRYRLSSDTGVNYMLACQRL